MAHQIVRTAVQFFFAEATDADEMIIAVRDHSFEIGGRHQMTVGGQHDFALSNRLVITHFIIKAASLFK